MKKRELAELALGLGLPFNEAYGVMFGTRRDYAFYLAPMEGNQFAIFFSLRSAEGYAAPEVLEALPRLSDIFTDYETAGLCVAYKIAACPDERELPQMLEQAIEDSSRFFAEQGLISACEKTGQTGQVELYQVDGELLFLTPASYKELVSGEKSPERQVRTRKHNYFLGFIGALLGSVLGGGLVFLLASMGKIASISGVLAALLTIEIYKRFAGGLSVFGLVISVPLVPTMCLLAYQLRTGYVLAAGDRVGVFDALNIANQAAFSGQLPWQYWLYGAAILLLSIAGLMVAIGRAAQELE